MNRDMIVGAWKSDTVAVIYSNMTMPSTFDISSLNGANGFTMRANSSLSSGEITIPKDLSGLGYALAAGDVRCMCVSVRTHIWGMHLSRRFDMYVYTRVYMYADR